MPWNLYNTHNYASPDGQDCLKKTLHTAKLWGITGAFASFYDAFGYTRVTSFPMFVGRFAFWTLPAVGVGATFAATSCISGTMRGKDGPVNHLIGGAIAGVMLGVKTHSFNVGLGSCVALAVGAGLSKAFYDEGLEVFPDIPYKEMGHHNHYKRKDALKPPENY